MNFPDWLIAAGRRVPLYQSLPERPTWPLYSHNAEDLEGFATARGDPFGGRHDVEHPPDVQIQAARGLPIYWALTASDLSALATVLAGSWTRLGITSGQRVALYDYATSPMVVYASRAYVPHLDAGAADIIGCLPICNDGLPSLADRCAHILEYVQPSILFIDAELMDPLLRALERKGSRTVSRVVVTSDEAPVRLAQIREWGALLGTEVQQMLRADAPLFFAPPCAIEPMTFHPDEAAYRIEVLSPDPSKVLPDNVGQITVTNLAIRSSIVIRYVTNVEGTVRDGSCRCGRTGRRVIVADVA
jgi:phenylacetate-coenzyme A ligase PaaK-like adenylate-forming protein